MLYIEKEMINFDMKQTKLDQKRKFLRVSGSTSDKTPWKSAVELDDTSPSGTHSGASSTSGKDLNRGALVLPDFTALIKDALENDKANKVWSQMINQLGDFY